MSNISLDIQITPGTNDSEFIMDIDYSIINSTTSSSLATSSNQSLSVSINNNSITIVAADQKPSTKVTGKLSGTIDGNNQPDQLYTLTWTEPCMPPTMVITPVAPTPPDTSILDSLVPADWTTPISNIKIGPGLLQTLIDMM